MSVTSLPKACDHFPLDKSREMCYNVSMSKRFHKWLRWKIAKVLNIFSDTCWAELVLWAMYPEHHEFSEFMEMRGTAGYCRQVGDAAYCGKCEVLE
jgi:hypothetical protein